MTATDPAALVTPPAGVPLTPSVDSNALFSAILDIAGTVDRDQIEPVVLRAATALLSADGASFWVVHGGALACPIAIGHGASQLLGKRSEAAELAGGLDTEESVAVATASVNVGGIHHAPGRTQVRSYLYLDDEDRKRLQRMEQLGVSVTARDLPDSVRVPLATLLKD